MPKLSDHRSRRTSNNAHELAKFKHRAFDPNEQPSLELIPQGATPFSATAKHCLRYTKETVTDNLIIIKKQKRFRGEKPNKHSHGDPVSFIWKTNAKTLKTAVNWGVFEPTSMTGKAIYHLGKYRAKVASRALAGYMSDKALIKDVLLDAAQQRIISLEKIEMLIHQDNTDELASTIDQCIKQLASLRDTTEQYLKYSTNISTLDSQAINKLTAQINGDIVFLKEHKTKCINYYDLKKQIYCIIRDAQLINQNISYSGNAKSFLRGDFHGFCEDAIHAVDNYNIDYQNPVLKEHHLDFIDEDNEVGDNEIIVDSASFGIRDSKQILLALQTISFVEGKDKLNFDREKLITDKSEQPLSVTNMTKWRSSGSAKVAATKSLAWIWNVTTGLTIGLTADLVGGLTYSVAEQFGLVRGPYHALAARVRISNRAIDRYYNPLKPIVFHEDSEGTHINSKRSSFSFEDTHASTLLKAATTCEKPIGYKFGQILGNFLFKQLTLGTLKGLYSGAKQLTTEFYLQLQEDYREAQELAAGTTFNNTWILIADRALQLAKQKQKDLDNDIIATNKNWKTSQTGLLDQHASSTEPTYGSIQTSKPQKTARLAIPAYPLEKANTNDILNAGANGLHGFMDLFMHNIYAKNPTMGLLFTAAYASGGFSLLAPKAVAAIFGKHYAAVSSTVGHAMAHGRVSSAIGGGFVQGKLAAGIGECLIHGPDSWMVKGFSGLARDPAKGLAYATLAVTVGYVLAYKLKIPFLSEYIQDDIGDFWPAAAGFAGAKLGMLFLELVHAEKDHHAEHDTKAIDALKAELEKLYRQQQKVPAEIALNTTQKNKIDELLNKFVGLKEDTLLREQINTLKDNLFNSSDAENMAATKSATQTAILIKLIQAKPCMPQLSRHGKHTLSMLIDNNFSTDEARSLKRIIYPEKVKSVMQTTITTTLGYIPLILRIVPGALITRNIKRPTKELTHKVTKDLTRIIRAAGKLTKTSLSFVNRWVFKPAKDIIVNEIIARAEGQYYGDRHYVSEKSFEFSKRTDCFSESTKEILSIPLDTMSRESMVKRPEVMTSKLLSDQLQTPAARFFTEETAKAADTTIQTLTIQEGL